MSKGAQVLIGLGILLFIVGNAASPYFAIMNAQRTAQVRAADQLAAEKPVSPMSASADPAGLKVGERVELFLLMKNGFAQTLQGLVERDHVIKLSAAWPPQLKAVSRIGLHKLGEKRFFWLGTVSLGYEGGPAIRYDPGLVEFAGTLNRS